MIERIGQRRLGVRPSGFGREARRQFRAGGRARHLIALGHAADDVRFHHDVGRPADHDEMLHVVAAQQHETAARVDRGRIEHGKARRAVPSAADEGRGGAAPDDPEHQCEAEKAEQHHHGGDDELCAALC